VLDDRALFMAGWRSRALAALDASALSGHPQRAEFRRLLTQSWDGHAGVSSVGYRLARGYMHALYAQLFGGADVAIHQLSESGDVDVASPRWPVVVARLLDEQPPGWLPPGYADWQAVSLAAIDHVIADLSKDGKPLAEASWGAFNTSRIGHPFARLLPALKPWLAAPAEPLPGDNNMPRVQGPAFGPSERMTLTPGHESTGIFNMPGGQSGHPLSPYFLAGHAAWVKAEATPFLPGPAMHTLTLLPAAAQP
jgi:penicillin amidase